MRVSPIQALLAAAVIGLALTLLSQPAAGQTRSDADKNVRATPAIGSVENGTYRNKVFGFQYKIPFGWVERTEQMRDASADPSKSLLLLAAFERPPEVKADSVNSAVVITAESTAAYPGLKTAADYFAPLTDVATGKGFQVVNEPYYFNVGGKRVVRGDFSKNVGQVTMYQSSLAMLERRYFVSFTFLGGSEDEVNELVEKLSLKDGGAKAAPNRK